MTISLFFSLSSHHSFLYFPSKYVLFIPTREIRLTKVLAALPHHLHGLVSPPVALVVVVETPEEQTLETHLGEQACLGETKKRMLSLKEICCIYIEHNVATTEKHLSPILKLLFI